MGNYTSVKLMFVPHTVDARVKMCELQASGERVVGFPGTWLWRKCKNVRSYSSREVHSRRLSRPPSSADNIPWPWVSEEEDAILTWLCLALPEEDTKLINDVCPDLHEPLRSPTFFFSFFFIFLSSFCNLEFLFVTGHTRDSWLQNLVPGSRILRVVRGNFEIQGEF